MAGQLGDTAFGGDVAVEDAEATAGFQWLVEGNDHFLARAFHGF